MKKLLVAVLLLASCSGSDDPEQKVGGNSTAPAVQMEGRSERSERPEALATLTGLYEGGGREPRHQMCVVKGQGGEQRFGLIVWGSNQHSCSGSGTVTRTGDRLRLAMAGDATCTIEASISGKTIKLPETVPQGCGYYCGERATLGGAELTQQGSTEQAAMRAKDLVGEPLCAGEGG
ncbi:MAG: hypothetical protein M3N39_06880 [Pseudomonadota bacterium]|nr:hypothetical protein [Pseudomonadota bacterium]